MNIEKAIERVRKYLSLAQSGNEHEAAEAVARAAQLMSDYQLTEAMLKVDDDSRASENIIEGQLSEKTKKRVAWKSAIAGAVASSLGGHIYYTGTGTPTMMGRESAVQSWTYTCAYLFREIERLAEHRWEAEREMAEAVGQSARSWCNAFRVGAAQVVARRLRDTTNERKSKRHARKPPGVAPLAISKHEQALAIIEREEHEVDTAYADRTRGWRTMSSIGSTSNRSGYHAGKEAGAGIALGGGRAGLPAGQGRLR